MSADSDLPSARLTISLARRVFLGKAVYSVWNPVALTKAASWVSCASERTSAVTIIQP